MLEVDLNLNPILHSPDQRGMFISEGYIADKSFPNFEKTGKTLNADEDLDDLFARIDAEVEDA